MERLATEIHLRQSRGTNISLNTGGEFVAIASVRGFQTEGGGGGGDDDAKSTGAAIIVVECCSGMLVLIVVKTLVI